MKKSGLFPKGSFTVEIALIMPVVLMVILIMFFYVLYMYNRGIMQNAACRGAKQAFYYINDNNDCIQAECTKIVLSDLEGSLVGISDTEVVVEVSANKIEVALNGRLNVPEIMVIKGTVFEELWKYDIRWEELRINSAEIIRDGQQLENIMEELKSEEVIDVDQI